MRYAPCHPPEWDEECRRNGADMQETAEDEAVREIAARRSLAAR
jgi:hypothetical protein